MRASTGEATAGSTQQVAMGALYTDFFEGTADAILFVEPTTGVILHANRAALFLFGCKSLAALPRRIAALNSFVGGVTANERSGRRVPMRLAMSFRRLAGDDGQDVAMVSIRDAGEGARRRMETLGMRSTSVDVLGRLVSSVAHDLNNTVFVVSSYAHFLLDSFAPEDVRREEVDQILAAGDRINRLSTQLLELGHSDNVPPAVLQVNELVEIIGEVLGRGLGQKITLAVDLDADLWPIVGGLRRVEWLIVTLVLQVRDALGGAGQVTVSTRNVSASAEQARGFGANVAGEFVCLEVFNDGGQLSSKMRERILAVCAGEFSRPTGGGDEAGRAAGAGMGAVGGLQVSEANEERTRVAVFWPRSKGGLAYSDRKAAEAAACGVVVLLHREAALRCITAQMLRKRGYVVLEGLEQHQAELLAQTHPAAVDVVLQGGMPVFDGSRGRARWNFGRIPVVLMESSVGEDRFIPEEVAGATILPVPFGERELLAAIRPHARRFAIGL